MNVLSRLRLRWLFIGANAVVLALPVVALVFLHVYDAYLLRQTERQLLAESVVIGEAFRDAWRVESGVVDDDHRPPGQREQRYVPVEPHYDLDTPVLSAQSPLSTNTSVDVTSPEARAGKRIESLLARAQTFNLSAIRVLDARGCVIATTRSERDQCMGELPEVKRALAGQYASAARERISDEPAPPLGDMRRRGRVRLFTALPVFSNGRVIAVVRASRTGLDALSSIWANRRGLLWGTLGVGVVMTLVSLLFSTAIAWPLRKLTHAASAIAEGKPATQLSSSGFAPAEIRVLGEVLESMRKKLEARANYVAEFASNASHELKTPITAIRGAAELLQHDWEAMEPAQRARFIDNIALDAARMDRLVTRLLLLARVENDKPEATHTIAVKEFFERFLARHGGAVALVLEQPPASIGIAEDHLISVVGNLVDNALRFGAGQPVRVVLSSDSHPHPHSYPQAARLRIEVSDRGPGISEHNQRHLFERFFTTSRDQGGTGLGLAIVKAIAQARGGGASAKSSAQGTTFCVVL